MLIYRWQSPVVPEASQVRLFFEREGLLPIEEKYPEGAVIKNHIHPLDEVRMVCTGSLLLDIAGNRLLLRGGDRIIIPSNTWHSKKAEKECISFCAFKPD